ncbi:General transcription factor IIH subunit 3 [Ceratobasidium theobromae]|uniref:General transcription and DNA repair factor IIH subunit TFB4 n=1 Tax=Ceratobasidium theobromae TaxID=1582974 RepID=A0A5N5QW92_9AGAM|nr:General transcription factor IIH subunit 3 [Ceratobasidium theobromae]
MDAPESTPPAHLILIIDLSPVQWQLSASATANGGQNMDLTTFVPQVLVFMNSHLACRQENSAAILGAFPGRSLTLYPTPPDSAQSNVAVAPEAESNTYHAFRSVDDIMMDRIQAELAALSEADLHKPIALVPSLTQALCQINRVAQPQQLPGDKPSATLASSTDSRILILSVSPDASTPYIPFMNCIFSAQKLMCFLSSASLRDLIELPSQGKVDFRASCFCHKDVVDVGYVCSVCLSIFCKPVVVCATCKTKFPIASYKKLLSATAVTKSNGTKLAKA